MKCKKCSADIPSENVNIQLAIAKCDVCSTVFSFQEDARTKSGVFEEEGWREPLRPNILGVGLPKGISVERTEDELRLRRKWFSPLTVALTLFAVFWDGFLIVWFSIALSQGAFAMAAAGSLHALVGAGITYFVLAGYLNTTLIAVNKEYLVIHHAPLPWPGTKTVEASGILQLYCKAVRGGSRLKTSSSLSYELRAVLKDSRDMRLLGGFTEDVQVLFIEQEVEKYLDIKDRPVTGEVWKN